MLVEETQIVSPYVISNQSTAPSTSSVAASTDVVTIPSKTPMGTTMNGIAGTAIHITARIISNTGWSAVRSKIEQFGASKIRENTMR
ncbi:UNVERIFIED_CONTAM: hypothetical protein HDU68_004362, partial [Siphonaria sp. JEL0065]